MIGAVGMFPRLPIGRPAVGGGAIVLICRRPRHAGMIARLVKYVVQGVVGVHVPGMKSVHGNGGPAARLCPPRAVQSPRKVRPHGREIRAPHVHVALRAHLVRVV